MRAGLAAKRLGAAEAVTQLERALALWDRVPDAQALAGRPQVGLVVLLAEAAGDRMTGNAGTGFSARRWTCSGRDRPVAGQPRLLRVGPLPPPRGRRPWPRAHPHRAVPDHRQGRPGYGALIVDGAGQPIWFKPEATRPR